MLLFALSSIVVLVVGCGDDDDSLPAANVISVIPADGSTVPANIPITVEFDNPVNSCTIAGKAATLSPGNRIAKIDAADLPEGSQTVEIKWVNKDGSKDSYSVTYTVSKGCSTPEIVSSSPKDGEGDVSIDEIHTNGIVIEFDEEIDPNNSVLNLTLEGTVISCWEPKFDGAKITLLCLREVDLKFGKEYKVKGTVSDFAGNETEVEISFTTESEKG